MVAQRLGRERLGRMVVCMVLAMAVVVDMLASELSVVVLFVEGNTAQHRFHLGPSECNPDIMTVVNAPFVAGRVTIDGLGNDWEGLPAQKMELMPATTLTYGDVEKHMPATLIIKGAHDGQNLYMLMSLPGKYVFNSSDNHLCPSVALMFAIGSRATFKSMGGCGSAFEECNSSTCAGHSVDVVHFKLETTIPGRLYGGNAVDNANFTGDDRFGHLSDSYGYNPRCRFLDGTSRHPELNQVTNDENAASGGAQNDWHGAWGHTSLGRTALAEFRPKDAPFGLVGAHGDYIFEFSRPLRTSDRLLQDAQLSIGQRHLFSAAIWYPTGDGRSPWTAEGHYVPSCNWMILELWQGQEPLGGWLTDSQASIEETSSKWLAVLSLLFALVAVGVSIAVGSYVQKHSRHFQHVNPNNL